MPFNPRSPVVGGWQWEDLGSPGRRGAAVSALLSIAAGGRVPARPWGRCSGPLALSVAFVCPVLFPSPLGDDPLPVGVIVVGLLSKVSCLAQWCDSHPQQRWPLGTGVSARVLLLPVSFLVCPVGSVACNRGPLAGTPSFEHACAWTLTSHLLWFTHCSGYLFLERWSELGIEALSVRLWNWFCSLLVQDSVFQSVLVSASPEPCSTAVLGPWALAQPGSEHLWAGRG